MRTMPHPCLKLHPFTRTMPHPYLHKLRPFHANNAPSFPESAAPLHANNAPSFPEYTEINAKRQRNSNSKLRENSTEGGQHRDSNVGATATREAITQEAVATRRGGGNSNCKARCTQDATQDTAQKAAVQSRHTDTGGNS